MIKSTSHSFLTLLVVLMPFWGVSQQSSIFTVPGSVVTSTEQQNKIECKFKKKITTIYYTDSNGNSIWKLSLSHKGQKAFGQIFVDESHFTFLTFNVKSSNLMIHRYDFEGNLIMEDVFIVKSYLDVFFSPDRERAYFGGDRSNKKQLKKIEFSIINLREFNVKHGNFRFFNPLLSAVKGLEIKGNHVFFVEEVKAKSEKFTRYYVLSEFDLKHFEFYRFREKEGHSYVPYELFRQYTLEENGLLTFIAGQIPFNLDLIIYTTELDRPVILDLQTDSLKYLGNLKLKKAGNKLFVAGLGYEYIDECVRPVGHFIYAIDLKNISDFKMEEQVYDYFSEDSIQDIDAGDMREIYLGFDRGSSGDPDASYYARHDMNDCNKILMKDILEFEIDEMNGKVNLTIQDVFKTMRFEEHRFGTASYRTISYQYHFEYLEQMFHHYQFTLDLQLIKYEKEKRDGELGNIKQLNPYGY